jgi:2-polyprenyl-3-methyl-5-hydroxy-6-metoxy-1,4-benzoquinol methylase
MSRSTIEETKRVFKPVFTQLVEEGKGRADFLEAAFSAYAHHNFLIETIFWGRLDVVASYILRKDFKNILDFGTGSGVLAYTLGHEGLAVTATDRDPLPFREIEKRVKFPGTVTFLTEGALQHERAQERFDAIVALDVLEHARNLSATITSFKRFLNPGGEIIVSGPTENMLYQIGRRLAGKEFTGTYHRTNVYIIEKTFKRLGWQTSRMRCIYPLLPLFIIFRAYRAGTM